MAAEKQAVLAITLELWDNELLGMDDCTCAI